MYKSKEFDYDLWTTTENGTKHYWARVKATGEVTEVSHEVMKFLRAEEKKLFREIKAIQKYGSTLSLDVPKGEDKESWFEDHGVGINEIETTISEKEFRASLTTDQLLVYEECLLGGKTEIQFAKEHDVSFQAVSQMITRIRNHAKKYFYPPLNNRRKMSVVG